MKAAVYNKVIERGLATYGQLQIRENRRIKYVNNNRNIMRLWRVLAADDWNWCLVYEKDNGSR